MECDRRKFLLGSGLMLLAGCQSASRHTGDAALPGTTWPSVEAARVPQPVTLAPVQPTPAPTTGKGTVVNPIPRSAWTSTGPRMNDIYAMDGVQRITIHHEGFKVVGFSDYNSCASHMELIRRSHVGARGFSDIGYHYIIDPAGRVYEGRDIRYQGAHVRDNNPHNLGIMCMGNYDRQQPTEATLRALADTVSVLRKRYNISLSKVKTHQEIVPTACPGRYMQPRIAALRSNGAFN